MLRFTQSVRMASKWHLSADSDGARNLLVLERVIQAFTPDLIQAVDELSTDFRGWLTQHKEQLDRLAFGASPTAGASGGLSSPRRSVAFSSPSSVPRVDPSIKSSGLIHIMHAQHKNLFPDPRVNDFKADMGVMDFRQFADNVSEFL